MSNESTGKAKLFAKVAAVMAAVRTIPKDGENKFDKYFYITGDAVFERVGDAMAKANLIALPSIIELTTTTGESQNGKVMLRTVIHGQITLADGETGDTWTSDWYGEGGDRGDKSINKAMTAMMKYYLLRLFMVGSGEDADEESPELPIKKQAPVQQPQRTSPPVAHRNTVEQLPVISQNGPVADEAPMSPARKRFHAEGNKTFGANWDEARHWLVEQYTKAATPSNERKSSSLLSDDECDVITDRVIAERGKYQRLFAKSQEQPVAA